MPGDRDQPAQPWPRAAHRQEAADVATCARSGCLTADTRVLRADTGAEIDARASLRLGRADVPVWSLDDSLRYVRRHLTHVFPTGRSRCSRVRLASGKRIRATGNRTRVSWHATRGSASMSTRVDAERRVPGSLCRGIVCAPEAADGLGRRGQVVLLAAPSSAHVVRAQPVRELIGEPSAAEAADRLFLRHLWADRRLGDAHTGGRGGRVYYASTSRAPAGRVLRAAPALRDLVPGSGRVPQARHRPATPSTSAGSRTSAGSWSEIGVHGRAASRRPACSRSWAPSPGTRTSTRCRAMSGVGCARCSSSRG